MAKAMRYAQVIALVEETKPETIIEIGVWNGGRAIEMAEAALRHSPKVHYRGYDLFELATPETDRDELNMKRHCTFENVMNRLMEFARANPGFTFDLISGNTRETLKPIRGDFVYIDGGHSVATINGDYFAVQDSNVIVFDDYYRPDVDGHCPDLEVFGANVVVDSIPGAEVLPSDDPVKGGGIVHIAVVHNQAAA